MEIPAYIALNGDVTFLYQKNFPLSLIQFSQNGPLYIGWPENFKLYMFSSFVHGIY